MKLKTPSSRGWIFAAVTSAIAIALQYVLPLKHYGSWWESIPGWWAWFGGIGCALIVVLSKWLGSLFLNKPGDWYD